VTPFAMRVVVVATALAAVAVAAVAERGDGMPPSALRVVYVYASPDADELVVPLIARFNGEHHRVRGREVRIVGTALTSGQAETAIAARTLRPALWTPASSLWGRLLDHDAGAEWLPSESPSLVSSPQVIAMWAPLARALGYPAKRIGWNDVLALATSSRGWGAYGHPEFGRFRLGHTNPDFSTSGLSAVASEYYAVTGKRAGLGLADIRRPEVRAAVRAIEHSIVHYGETAKAFTKQMDRYGPGYAHAVYVQDFQVRAFNAHRRRGATRLVQIVPAEGTFVADYPLIALRAPWVGADTLAAAALFRRWLPPQITASMAAKNGFRLRSPADITRLEPPAPDVLAAIREGWRRDRKAANIVLVVDTSSSMGGAGRLDAAKVGLLSFLRELSPRDRVALVTSGSTVATRVPLGLPARSRLAVERAVRGLFPNGEQPVYAAISRALGAVRALHDPSRINAVVVLSDGAGTATGYRALLDDIHAEPVTEGTSVRIFAVAYGDDANARALERIATESGGAFFAGGPDDIKDVYRKVASYF
jgi:Ca-activated chloride channel family protein